MKINYEPKKIDAWKDSKGAVHHSEDAARKAEFKYYLNSIYADCKEPLPSDAVGSRLWADRYDLVDFIMFPTRAKAE